MQPTLATSKTANCSLYAIQRLPTLHHHTISTDSLRFASVCYHTQVRQPCWSIRVPARRNTENQIASVLATEKRLSQSKEPRYRAQPLTHKSTKPAMHCVPHLASPHFRYNDPPQIRPTNQGLLKLSNDYCEAECHELIDS